MDGGGRREGGVSQRARLEGRNWSGSSRRPCRVWLSVNECRWQRPVLRRSLPHFGQPGAAGTESSDSAALMPSVSRHRVGGLGGRRLASLVPRRLLHADHSCSSGCPVSQHQEQHSEGRSALQRAAPHLRVRGQADPEDAAVLISYYVAAASHPEGGPGHHPPAGAPVRAQPLLPAAGPGRIR